MSSWFNFFYADYTEHFISTLVKTRYSKRQLTFVLELLLTQIIRFYIKVIITPWFQLNPVIDFFMGVIISLILILNTNELYKVVHTLWYDKLYSLSRYLINNYSAENFKRWKRNVVIVISLVLIVQVSFIEITTKYLLIQIFQFLFSYLIIDQMEDMNSSILRELYIYLEIIKKLYYKIETFFQDLIQQYISIVMCAKKSIIHQIKTPSSSEEETSDENLQDYSNQEKENMILQKSWMKLDNIQVINDTYDSSIVTFQGE